MPKHQSNIQSPTNPDDVPTQAVSVFDYALKAALRDWEIAAEQINRAGQGTKEKAEWSAIASELADEIRRLEGRKRSNQHLP